MPEAGARPFELTPVVLEGQIVRLEPLSLDDVAALTEVVLPAELWRWTTTRVRNEAEMREYVETALRWQALGTALPGR